MLSCVKQHSHRPRHQAVPASRDEEPVTDVVDIPVMTAVRRVIDSKAMRKVRNRELQLVIENTSPRIVVSVSGKC